MAEMADNILPIRQSKQQQRIIELIKRFPDFAGIIPDYILNYEFDPTAFDEWASSTPISKGEKIIARFVLGVWDSLSTWKVGRFDIFEAANVFDSGNWRVIQEWCQNPFLL